MSGVCRDCKWWVEDIEEIGTFKQEVMYPGFVDGWRHCERTATMRRKLLDDTSLAAASDGDGYNAILFTAPDFGCNQFQEANRSQ